MPKYRTRLELMLTLECHWGCADCCRGLEKHYPKDSHMTLEQARRFIKQLEDDDVYVTRLKIDGGDPCFNPDFEELIWLFASYVPERFKTVKVQTAYSKEVIAKKYKLPPGINLRCEPLDDKRFKSHHVPWFVSPSETGVLPEGAPPPLGSWATQKPCELQVRCGRSWERWGFTACAQEAVIGRMIGKVVHQDTYKHWADPEICKHCPMCLGKTASKDLQQRAANGEFDRVSPVLNVIGLKEIYDTVPERQQPW